MPETTTTTTTTTTPRGLRPTVDVNALTFGVELETTIPRGLISVGRYHAGASVAALPPGWTAQSDCSIQAPAGHEAAEIVSPILRGADGLEQIVKVCEWLNSIGAKVNRSTGLHVHVGWTGDRAALGRLTYYVSNHETALYASTGTRSRQDGRYCKSIRVDETFRAVFRDGSRDQLPWDRYHILNLTNIGSGRKNTVEFRCFAGTTNALKILGYVRLCLGLVEKALSAKKTTKWVAKTPTATSPIHRKGGEGQTELTRLFYALGWTHGRESHTFGNVHADGLPTIADAKREFIRLGAKYDQRHDDSAAAAPTPGAAAAAPAAASDRPLPPWAHWTAGQWDHWRSNLRRGSRVRVHLSDGTHCDATIVRRYAVRTAVRVSHLSRTCLVTLGQMEPVADTL